MEKINKLKRLIKKKNIDGYIIPKNDEYFCEYIPYYNDRLKYISKFTGSFGFALILKNKSFLFIDGRYSLQAKIQSGKYFQIKTFPNLLPRNVLKSRNLKIGFDPKLFNKRTLAFLFRNTKCKLKPIRQNLIDEIWKRNKKFKVKKIYILPKQVVGQSAEVKINKVVSKLKKVKADYHFISSSENNSWLLNIRGKDAAYTPIINCFSLVDVHKNIKFFCDLRKIPIFFKRKFKKIEFVDIKFADFILSKINKKKFIIDNNTCSIHFENIITKNNKILNQPDPIYNFKSIKSKNEINNMSKAHIYDGVALTKYLIWLKNNYQKRKITEISAEKKLLSFRKKNKTFKFSSFPTISGSGPNGAIIHYKAEEDSNRKLKKGDIYLVDSGGQYEFGTTDVTRTIALGNAKKRVKNIFTRVLKGHIAVTNFNLTKRTAGSKIDVAARKYLKEINLDYAHGTGHGVGYFLNVHEGPQSISKNNKVFFKEGMVVSNEPGYYEKDNFGIRIENLIYVKRKKNRIKFENLTFAPIDKSLIDQSILSTKEKKWINSYHQEVYFKLRNYMNKKEVKELEQACSAI